MDILNMCKSFVIELVLEKMRGLYKISMMKYMRDPHKISIMNAN